MTSVTVGVVLVAAAFPAAFVGLRKRARGSERDKRWEALTASVDVQDPFLLRKLGPYRTISRLGSGGMSTVCKAVPDDTLDESKAVAVKIIHPRDNNPEFKARFVRECQVSMKLNHPNVLRVREWGDAEELTYLVMDLIEGDTLVEKIPDGGMAIQDAMQIIPPLIEGLAYAHSLGIVHRDLKPHNIILGSKGKVTLMDFGLARSAEVKTVTTDGNMMGTAAYIAPEQITSPSTTSALTQLSDQYSLGIVIYELLCGRRPFEEEHPWKMVMAHLQERPPSIRRFRPDLPGEVENVLNKMLAKDPDARYPSVRDAGAALASGAMQNSSKIRMLTSLPPPLKDG